MARKRVAADDLVRATVAPISASPAPLAGRVQLELPTMETLAPARVVWCRVYTDGRALNLRARPGLDQEILFGLLPGMWVQVCERSAEMEGWLLVRTVDLRAGWIAAEFCKEVTR